MIDPAARTLLRAKASAPGVRAVSIAAGSGACAQEALNEAISLVSGRIGDHRG